MNTPDEKEDRFEDLAKRAFDDSVDALDGETLSKLNRGRQAALANLGKGRRTRLWTLVAPAAGVTAAAVVAVVMLNGPVPEEAMLVPSATDFEILVGDDSLEMLEELEFYSWLDTVDAEAADNAG